MAGVTDVICPANSVAVGLHLRPYYPSLGLQIEFDSVSLNALGVPAVLAGLTYVFDARLADLSDTPSNGPDLGEHCKAITKEKQVQVRSSRDRGVPDILGTISFLALTPIEPYEAQTLILAWIALRTSIEQILFRQRTV